MSVRRRTKSSSEDLYYFENRAQKRRSSKVKISNGGYSLINVVIICIIVSVFCQIFLPPLWGYIEQLIQGSINKKKRIESHRNVGGLISQSEKYQTSAKVKKPTFLVDPIYDEKWKDAYLKMPILKTEEDSNQNNPMKIKEALAAARAAKKSRKNGNLEKAAMIIEHAIALAPNNPDILIEMGQLKEENKEMIEADHCYVRALVFDPENLKAVSLRARTRPIVSAIDRQMLKNVHDLRDEFAHLQHSTALRRMMRETYFLYVYHTVAIEGNTLDLGQTRSILESGIVIPGKSIREHNEVIGMDAALRFLNSSLLSRDHDIINIEDILEMHRRVLGNADPLEAGKLRTTQVYVGKFTPVGPEYVLDQMTELVDWLNEESTMKMDPIEKAAIAHYKLVLVHPFTDGNGRTARLLLNLIMMRNGFPPVILPVETRAEYYATLHVANLGDLRPFVRYVAKYASQSINKYIGAMKTEATCIENDEKIEGKIKIKMKEEEEDCGNI